MTKSFEPDATTALFELTAKSVISPFRDMIKLRSNITFVGKDYNQDKISNNIRRFQGDMERNYFVATAAGQAECSFHRPYLDKTIICTSNNISP